MKRDDFHAAIRHMFAHRSRFVAGTSTKPNASGRREPEAQGVRSKIDGDSAALRSSAGGSMPFRALTRAGFPCIPMVPAVPTITDGASASEPREDDRLHQVKIFGRKANYLRFLWPSQQAGGFAQPLRRVTADRSIESAPKEECLEHLLRSWI